jgi:hypothetical protein
MFAALGIILIVAGAIVTFAIDRQAEGVDLEALGWILMAGGALSLLISLFVGASWWSTRGMRAHTERHVSPDGATVVEDSQVS